MRIKNLFHIYKYPRYLTDYFLIEFYILLWNKKCIKIGENTTFLGIPIITSVKGSEINIGKNCLLCSRSSKTALGVSHSIVIRTLRADAEIDIGDNVRMSGTTICAAMKVALGDRCVIGADVIISDTDFHSLSPEVRNSKEDSGMAICSPIKIGNDVFIGARSIILKGVILGNNVVIGAGSIVTCSFENNSIIAGNPAKLIGHIQ